jgi:hypothetical protein
MRTAVEQKEKEDNKVKKNKAKDLAWAKRKREAMIRDLLLSSSEEEVKEEGWPCGTRMSP